MLFVDHSDSKTLHQPSWVQQKDDFLFYYQDKKIGLLPDNQVPQVKKTSQEIFFCFGMIKQHHCFLSDRLTDGTLNFIDVRSSCSLLR